MNALGNLTKNWCHYRTRPVSTFRFVDKEHDEVFRVMKNALGKANTLLESLGKGIYGLISNIRKKATLDCVFDPLCLSAAGEAPYLSYEIEESNDRHVRIHRCIFGEITDSLSCR